jgi:2-hydroxycyclohexanecarboxyl-CoA dehydrogenase
MAQLAVVTGAGSGIGRAIALGLAGQGSRVIAADLDTEGAEATALVAEGIVPMQVDIADRSSVDGLRDQVRELGTPEVLVNAAGWDRTFPFVDTPTDVAEKIVAINYLGHVHMCSAFLPGMVEAGEGGRVVNIASDAGRVGSSGEAVYAGAKGGVIALSKSLAREMARHRITVNVVCPGPTDTPHFAAHD